MGQEFIHLTAPGSLQQVTVPTALERQGDFSQTLAVNGTVVPVTDPLSHAPFPGNIVPQSRLDPNGQKLLEVFPLPNITNRAITKGNYNYNFLESLPGTPPVRHIPRRLQRDVQTSHVLSREHLPAL